MTRKAAPLVVSDLSAFARNLGRALRAQQARSSEPVGHLHLQNLIARAAGYRNLQALKAAAPPLAPLPLLGCPTMRGAR